MSRFQNPTLPQGGQRDQAAPEQFVLAADEPAYMRQSFTVRSNVEGFTPPPINRNNATPATLALFAEAERLGYSFVVTDVQTQGNRRVVTYQLQRQTEQDGETVTSNVGQPLIVRTPIPANPTPGLENTYTRTRNTHLAERLRRHVDQPVVPRTRPMSYNGTHENGEHLVAMLPELPGLQLPGQHHGGHHPVMFTGMVLPPATETETFDALSTRMQRAGFALRETGRTDGQVTFQVVQLNTLTPGQPGSTRSIGTPITIPLADFNDPARRTATLVPLMLNRLNGSDFEARSTIASFLAEQREAPLAVANIVDRSRRLTAQQKQHGMEIQFGDALAASLTPHLGTGADAISAADLRSIRMPLLHTLQRIEQDYPGYLQSIGQGEGGPERLRQFTLAVARDLLAARRGMNNAVLLDNNTHFVGYFNHETQFAPGAMETLLDRFGVTGNERRTIFRGTGSPTGETNRAAFLQRLETAAGADRNTLVWFAGHSDGTRIEFSSSSTAANNQITARQIAEALLRGREGNVDLSRLRLGFDCCNSHVLASNVMTELQTLAGERRITITGFPVMITSSHPDSTSWIMNRPSGPESYLATVLRTVTPGRPGVMTLQDFMAADNTASDVVSRAAGSWTLRFNANSGGDNYHLAIQDPALFATTPISSTTIISNARTWLGARDVTIPAPPARTLPLHRTRPLEISRENPLPSDPVV